MKRKCENCRHFIDTAPEHCRRYPPVVVSDGKAVAYPVVKPEWSCGEHEFGIARLLKRKESVPSPR